LAFDLSYVYNLTVNQNPKLKKKAMAGKDRDPKTGQYLSTYENRFAAMLEEHLGNGYSFTSFAAVIGVNRDTILEWSKTFPDFAEAKSRGTDKSLLFWEKMGITAMVGKIENFKVGLWVFNMKNRFGWRDRTEVKTTEEDFTAISHQKIMNYIEGNE
jgi:hypothetical protein